MKKSVWFLLAPFILVGLISCGGDEAVKPDESIDGGGVETSGTDGSDASGSELGGGANMALLDQTQVYFEFDSSAIDSDSRAVIEAHAAKLAGDHSSVNLEGHGDERGTREYNLALGERRAQAVARMLRALGVSGSQISTVSYGEEKPADSGHNESSWRQNRRVVINH